MGYRTIYLTYGERVVSAAAVTSSIINVIPTIVAVPNIIGTPQVGQTLMASPGTWTNNPTIFLTSGSPAREARFREPQFRPTLLSRETSAVC
jgi:hypothetical protein